MNSLPTQSPVRNDRVQELRKQIAEYRHWKVNALKSGSRARAATYSRTIVRLLNEIAALESACHECGGNGATPADDTPFAEPVRCPTCKDPSAARPRFRSTGDLARNDPAAYAALFAGSDEGQPDADWPY